MAAACLFFALRPRRATGLWRRLSFAVCVPGNPASMKSTSPTRSQFFFGMSFVFMGVALMASESTLWVQVARWLLGIGVVRTRAAPTQGVCLRFAPH